MTRIPGFTVRGFSEKMRCTSSDSAAPILRGVEEHPSLSGPSFPLSRPRSPTMRPLFLLLVSLVPPVDVSGFLIGGGVSVSRRTPAAPRTSTSTATAGARTAAAPHAPAMSADGVPAVVVSFGLTPRERLVAEEAVFRGGHTFPTGVRFLDGSAAEHDGSTIRQVRKGRTRRVLLHEGGAFLVIQVMGGTLPSGEFS